MAKTKDKEIRNPIEGIKVFLLFFFLVFMSCIEYHALPIPKPVSSDMTFSEVLECFDESLI